MPESNPVDDWFLRERGITTDTLNWFGVKRDSNRAIFPYPNGEKSRTGFDGSERTFRFTAGVAPDLFVPSSFYQPSTNTAAFICEGESDTMRLWQELGETADVYGLAGVHTWQADFAKLFERYEFVFVVLDNESEYDNPRAYEAVENAWLQIRKDLGTKAKRVRLPMGIKDLCEFFGEYTLDTLRLLAQKPTNSVSRFKPLDLTREPPPVNWLMDGLIARGDMTLISGASGLGKSWITMGLTVAVADGHQSFLGCDLHGVPGRILYFDEENPEDVIFHRLKKLGLENVGNVRYLWNNGVRVDRHPEVLLEEALEYGPSLVVLDSLTRIHGKEENNAGEMAPLLNDAIRPLARDTGAAVVVIHHHDKAGNGPRGSGDITASMDGALDVFTSNVPGQFTLKLSKSRRRLAGDGIIVKITDIEGGGVRLLAATTLDAPF